MREKLDDNQKKGLDFLKEALSNESDFNNFLNAEESKIKEAIDHIQSEIAKCTGENAEQQKKKKKKKKKNYIQTSSRRCFERWLR